MGNRASIFVTSDNFVSPIHLYGHWSGRDNVRAVSNVVDRAGVRIGDPSYLTAQLTNEFFVLGLYEGETGFGVAAWGEQAINDNADDNPLVIVNADTGIITYEDLEYEPAQFVEFAKNLTD
jgi:hypothetical protein